VSDGFIFWTQALRVTGTGSTANAVARLQTQLSAGRFSMQERLVGSLEGDRLRVWKASAFVKAGDVVEFEGTLRPGAEGTVIEGGLQYKIATKIQFVGLLAIGLIMLVAGALQKLQGADPGEGLLGMGGVVSLVTLLWIYASSRTKDAQIKFIEARLGEAVAR
jgi:hypothetical protein